MDPPPRPSSRSPSRSPSNASSPPPPPQPTLKQRAQIKTHHCRFCSHLLLATTQDLASLPRRRGPAGDRAIILPLPEEGGEEEEDDEEDEDESDDEEVEAEEGEGEGEARPARRPSPTQQKDEKEKQKEEASEGKEKEESEESQVQKRLRLLRKHYTILLSTTLPDRKHTVIRREDGFEKRLLLRCGRCRVVVGYVLDEEAHRVRSTLKGGADGEKEGDARAKVVYILPGSLVGTEEMGGDVKVEKEEWAQWIKS